MRLLVAFALCWCAGAVLAAALEHTVFGPAEDEAAAAAAAANQLASHAKGPASATPKHIRGGFKHILYACYPRFTSCYNGTNREKRGISGCDDEKVPISQMRTVEYLTGQLETLKNSTVFGTEHQNQHTLKLVISGSEWHVRAPNHAVQYEEADYKRWTSEIGSVMKNQPSSYMLIPGTFMWAWQDKSPQSKSPDINYMINCAPLFQGGRDKPITHFCKEGQDDELDVDRMLWAADSPPTSFIGRRWKHYYRASTPRVVENRAVAVDICADYVTETGPATRLKESLRTKGRMLDLLAIVSNNMQIHHPEGRLNEHKFNGGGIGVICDGNNEIYESNLEPAKQLYPAAAFWMANQDGSMVQTFNDHKNHTVPLPGVLHNLTYIGKTNVRGHGEQVWYFTPEPVPWPKFSVRHVLKKRMTGETTPTPNTPPTPSEVQAIKSVEKPIPGPPIPPPEPGLKYWN